ncbi:mycinamicin VI 2''-O-methyltransferase [Ditylenchus destructor]|uniref:Mycinamicin VI 2''-O-methyltransferase n=1 Tax=Ditylenchus destructor TaxID=166010 RepID=A0AAD4MHI0_9BILA|nr:mycinamicin VI 2''-O-methyltransferase [Ditylenchus destructor]
MRSLSLKKSLLIGAGSLTIIVAVISLFPRPYIFLSEYEYLDKLAYDFSYGKDSGFHNYTKIYYKLFAPYRDRPIKLLEMGIFEGGSAKLWEVYLPKAELHFIDITDQYVKHRSERSKYHFFNASDTQKLEAMARKYGPFDIIIDDASHLVSEQIASFQTLFPHVKSGGVYVIEDLHTNYWVGNGGHGSRDDPKAGKGTAIEFLNSLVDDVNFYGATTLKCHTNNLNSSIVPRMSYYALHIDSIRFYSCLSVIEVK